MKKFFLMMMVIIMGLPTLAHSGEPTDEIQTAIEQVIQILKDPKYQTEDQKEEQREALWGVIRKVFDFEKISELALGNYRKKFTPTQMSEFSDLFADLLSDNYLKQVQKEFKNDKVTYQNEIVHPNDKNRVLVKTTIIRENVEIPVDYSMWKNNDKWRVYDVKVEGVSLVRNYRTQFQEILLKDSPAQLIEKLKKKTEK